MVRAITGSQIAKGNIDLARFQAAVHLAVSASSGQFSSSAIARDPAVHEFTDGTPLGGVVSLIGAQRRLMVAYRRL